MPKFIPLIVSFILVLMATVSASAIETPLYKAYSIEGDFEDVLFDVQDAIINQGLVVDYTGNIGGMLRRTRDDVGSTVNLYANAKFLLFCSARLSRATMEADVHNINLCPYIISVYETADEVGTVYVSYRKPAATLSGTPHKAIVAVEKMLDAIAREATAE